ncbi:hypothetical protein GCM10010435_58020 [Winogradskya consettensis]|uniref:Uncharacterized protein n=1 Tax=Winogradskya consettensis TaxID=113560 RepID=A0A919S7P4_9ACTN|nr:DUF6082 family protein [Actinoplanes consettensis]GIM66989.1 hypothetical protein Aco04nite_04300 [Actinoplanes consettensis]
MRWRNLRLTLVAVGITGGIAVVLWSPLIMYRVLGPAMPWHDLADAGQAYGGPSALLSAAALCGIGLSLIMQSKQIRQELTGFDRQRHFDLIKLALDNPEFFEVYEVGQVTKPQDRQKVYANLTMNYWLAIWELDEMNEATLRNLTASMFSGEIARSWWQQQRETWITVRTRRRRRFMSVVNEEWNKANSTAPPRPAPRPDLPCGTARRQQRGRKRRGAVLSLALLGAVAAAHVYRRRASGGRSTHRL